MVLQIDPMKSSSSNGNGKCHSYYSEGKVKSWDDPLPVPSCILPWSSWIIFFISVLCFGNSILGEFVFDDSEAVINNLDLKPDTPLSNIFKNDFWGTKVTHNSSHKSYRPLTVLTFRLNYFVTGLHPYSFHLVNILLHGTVSALVLKVMYSLLTKTLEAEAPKAAFLSALLFSVHPIHTESVSAVVGRADLLCGIFFLLSFLSYIHASKCHSTTDEMEVSFLWLGGSIILAGLAMLCKEQGITVIGVCCVYDLIIICKLDLQDIYYSIFHMQNRCVPFSNGNKKVFAAFFTKQLILFLGGCFLLSLRWYVMGASTPVFQQVDNPASFESNILVRIVNYHYIYAMNVWLLFHPYWLCFDWSMGCIPLIKSFSDKRLIAVLIFWTFFAHLLYSIGRHPDRKIRRLLCLSLAFILVPFLPASNLFFRVGFVVAERVLYLPSMGFCMLIVIGLKQLTVILGQHCNMSIQCCIILLIAVFGVRCIQRSADWKSEETLFRSGLKVCPLNAKVHYNIAKNAADNGDRETAIKRYKEAIRLNPLYDQAMNNLANILKDQGKLIEAEELLFSAIKIRPDFAAAWMNLGIVQSSLKKMVGAERSYLMAIQYRKRYPDCYYNLGNLGFSHAVEQALKNDVEFRKSLPKDYLEFAGALYSDCESKEKSQFIKKFGYLAQETLKHLSVDHAVDAHAIDFIHGSMPPILSKVEENCSIHGNGSCININPKTGKQNVFVTSQLTPETKIRWIRKRAFRLVMDEEGVRLFYSLGNSKNHKEDEASFMEMDEDVVPAINLLFKSHPDFVKVKDFPIDCNDTKLEVAQQLYDNGFLMTEEPLPFVA